MKQRKNALWVSAVIFVAAAAAASASFILQEGFDSSTSGWVSYPAGNFVLFTNSLTFGNPAGSLFGDFAEQGIPVPRLDAFRADLNASGGQYVRDYTADPNFEGWTFSLYTTNNLPTTITFGFDAGANGFFSYPLTAQFNQSQTWVQLLVPSTYSPSWTGGDAAAFATALTTVQAIEIQISDANMEGQRYYLDGMAVVVPEPGSAILMAIGLAGLFMTRCIKRKTSY